jgi:hypothetical protein
MYFHTSLSVLISFISFSSLSLFCFFFSLHLPLYLLFASRNLLCRSCSSSILSTPLPLPSPLAHILYLTTHFSFLHLLTHLLSPPFSSFLSRSLCTALPPSSPRPAPQMLLFLVSSCTLPLLIVHAYVVRMSIPLLHPLVCSRSALPIHFLQSTPSASSSLHFPPCLLFFFYHPPSLLHNFLLLILLFSH